MCLMQCIKSYFLGLTCVNQGTVAFEKLLSASFDCIEFIPLPNWGDTCYSLTVWHRRSLIQADNVDTKQKSLSCHPFRCSCCGSGAKQLFRCRLSCNIYFCNESCAANGKDIHFDELVNKSLICKTLNKDSTQSSNENLVLNESIKSSRKRNTSHSTDEANLPTSDIKKIKAEGNKSNIENPTNLYEIEEDANIALICIASTKYFRKVYAPSTK